MIRLTGLPAPARFPEAEVEGRPDAVRIVFSGAGGSQVLEIPLDYVATDDLEGTLLRLLADLGRRGYRPSWRRDPDAD
jgi:hypothetical protein